MCPRSRVSSTGLCPIFTCNLGYLVLAITRCFNGVVFVVMDFARAIVCVCLCVCVRARARVCVCVCVRARGRGVKEEERRVRKQLSTLTQSAKGLHSQTLIEFGLHTE